MNRSRGKLKKKILITVGTVFFLSLTFGVIHFFPPGKYSYSQSSVKNFASSTVSYAEVPPPVIHVTTPKEVKAVYMSQCAVGTPSFRKHLIDLIDTTELNAIVIDIKDYTGKIAFPTENSTLKDSVSTECGARDMKDFVKSLHEKNIYVIGRITVFQDPYYTKKHPEQAVQSRANNGPWKDYKGLSFIDVSSTKYWEYVVALSKESYALGFDELNYDYIRYPSDGPMKDAVYVNPRKAEAVEKFWAFLHENVKPLGVTMSADLFGMTTTNTDDLNIGQQMERAMPYFDYIAPMVYPSHYPNGFLNLGNPNKYPYKVVNHSLTEAVRRLVATSTMVASLVEIPIPSTTPQMYGKKSYDPNKIRPWLQDFDYGGNYGPVEVRAQIKATYDAGLNSWMLWDAANKYTPTALESAPPETYREELGRGN